MSIVFPAFSSGSVGKSSRGRPAIRNTTRSHSIVAQALKLAGESGALAFDEVETGFKIENGRVHTPKVKLGQGALRLRLMGSVGLDGSVDYVLGMKPKTAKDMDPFEEILAKKKRSRGVQFDSELSALDLKDLVARFKSAIRAGTGKPFPEDPYEQLWGSIGAVFEALREVGALTAEVTVR